MATVQVVCAGCGKYVGTRSVPDPYYGPQEIKGCCEVCFPPKAGTSVKEPEPVEEPAKAE